MNKIIDVKNIDSLSNQFANDKQRKVLVGGCFDIIHIGHIKFLTRAKALGDKLIVALESDGNVRRLKGDRRPINSQDDRAQILAHIGEVDFILKLPDMNNFDEYKLMVEKIKPDIIALTAEDKYSEQKREQAQMIGALFKIIDKFETYSTSKLAQILGLD